MASTTVAERRARLQLLRRAVVAYRTRILEAVHEDLRRPEAETEFAEVHHVIQEIDVAIRGLPRWTRPERIRPSMLMLGTASRIVREPKGVVLIIAPWNYPFALVINPLVAAIAGGNCVVLKASEKTPATAALVGQLIAETFPAKEVAVVHGGPEVGQALLELPFDHIFYTGGTKVGRQVMVAAAQFLSTVTLELGGKSPAIVTSSADVTAAARRIAWGKFYNAGQTCTAPDYVAVPEELEERLIEELGRAVSEFFGKAPEERRNSPDLGRIVDAEHHRRLAGLIGAAVQEGAKLEFGGDVDEADRYVSSTVLSGVTFDSLIMEEEIFGPVLPVIRYRKLEDVVARIAEKPSPLALYVFGKDRSECSEVVRRIPSGGATINNTLLHYVHSGLPFGGRGASGMGSYHGYHGFREMTHARPVVRQREPALSRFFFPPYQGRLHRWARTLVRKLE